MSRVYQPMRGSSPISASKSGRKLNYWGIEAVLPSASSATVRTPVGSRKILQNQVYVYLVAYHLHHHRLPIKNPGNPWLYATGLWVGFHSPVDLFRSRQRERENLALFTLCSSLYPRAGYKRENIIKSENVVSEEDGNNVFI